MQNGDCEEVSTLVEPSSSGICNIECWQLEKFELREYGILGLLSYFCRVLD
jgi:hypothetical protein